MVGVDFDEEAQRRFAALTGSHLNQRLAMLLNDRVVCMPFIKTKLSRRALISGRFDDEEIREMLRALQAGMVTAPDTTSAQPEKADESVGQETDRKGDDPSQTDGAE